jgi:hypothetical protein
MREIETASEREREEREKDKVRGNRRSQTHLASRSARIVDLHYNTFMVQA